MSERGPGHGLARARHALVAATAVSMAVSCAPNLTSLARKGRGRQVCEALADEKAQLLRATDARLSFDVVPHASLAEQAGVELRGEPADVALRVRVVQDPASPFRVGLVSVSFSSTPSVGVPPAYALPPMPHRARVLAQGKVDEDATTRTVALLGHAATGGVALLVWRLVGRDPRDLVPDVRQVPEPGLSDEEKSDIAAWASRREVRYFLDLDRVPARGRSELVQFFPQGSPRASTGARFGPASYLTFTLAISYEDEPGCSTQVRGSLLLSKKRSTETAVPAYVPQSFQEDVSSLLGRGVLRLADHPELFEGGG